MASEHHNGRSNIAEIGAPFSTIRMALTALFVTAMLIGAMLSAKVILVADYPLPGGIFIFPLTYVIVTITAEAYGIAVAWRLIFIGIGSLTLAWLLATIIVHAPAAQCCTADAVAFQHMYDVSAPTILIVDAAFLIGQACAIWTLKTFARLTQRRLVWMRYCGSPMLAQIVVVIVSLPLIMRAQTPSYLIAFIIGRSLLAVIYSCVMLPVIYAAVMFIRLVERPRSFQHAADTPHG